MPASARRPRSSAESPGLPNRATRTTSTWRAVSGAGLIVGAVLFLLGLAIVLISWQRAGDADGLLRVLWALIGLAGACAAVGVAVLVARLQTMKYSLENAQLVVSAIGYRLAIPLDEIVDVIFRPRDLIDITGYERFWPGFYDSLRATSEGYWRSFATTPPPERVRIRLRTGLTVAISPERPVLFVDALEAYRRSFAVPGAAQPYPDQERPSGTTFTPEEAAVDPSRAVERRPGRFDRIREGQPVAVRIFRERIVRGDQVASNLLALNLIALIVLTTITSWRSDAVNAPLAVHWDARGEPTWFVRPDGIWVFEGIWIYPLTAAAIIAVNAALATLAAAAGRMPEARLLLSASLIATLLFLVGLWRTTGASLPVLG